MQIAALTAKAAALSNKALPRNGRVFAYDRGGGRWRGSGMNRVSLTTSLGGPYKRMDANHDWPFVHA